MSIGDFLTIAAWVLFAVGFIGGIFIGWHLHDLREMLRQKRKEQYARA